MFWRMYASKHYEEGMPARTVQKVKQIEEGET